MSIRSLLLLILKITGLFFLRDFIAALPQILSLISVLMNFGSSLLSPVIAGFLAVTAYGYMAYVLIIKTEWLIDKLQLDKGFEVDPVRLNIHRSTVLSISTIVIGALMVTNAVPPFVKYLLDFDGSKGDNLLYSSPKFDWGYIGLNGLPILIGLLMMGNQRQLVNFVELKRTKQAEGIDAEEEISEDSSVSNIDEREN